MRLVPWILVCALWVVRPASAGFTEFESGPVRPIALSPDGQRLYAVNTPDDRLEIFDVGPGGLTMLNRSRTPWSMSVSSGFG